LSAAPCLAPNFSALPLARFPSRVCTSVSLCTSVLPLGSPVLWGLFQGCMSFAGRALCSPGSGQSVLSLRSLCRRRALDHRPRLLRRLGRPILHLAKWEERLQTKQKKKKLLLGECNYMQTSKLAKQQKRSVEQEKQTTK